jgi:hypothetical protein
MNKERKQYQSTNILSSANILLKESFSNLDLFSVRKNNKPETIIMNRSESNLNLNLNLNNLNNQKENIIVPLVKKIKKV